MAKANLGDKQLCPNCGAKFYDLGKRPATCPKCATAFDPSDESVRLKRTRRAPVGKAFADDEEEVAEAAETGDEEEVEESPELDAEGADEVVLETDDDDDDGPGDGDLPPGFSEDESDLDEDSGSEDDVPLLEDEEEFNEDELGEIASGDDD